MRRTLSADQSNNIRNQIGRDEVEALPSISLPNGLVRRRQKVVGLVACI